MCCDKTVLGMIATRTFLAVEWILAFGRKIAKDRLIVLRGGMEAIQRLTLNSHHCQSAIQNTKEIWRKDEEKTAILLESWLQCLSYWNNFVRISCFHLVFLGRHSSVDKASANTAARLASWVGRPKKVRNFNICCWLSRWFPYLRQKAVFWMPVMGSAGNIANNYRRGGPDYRIAWGGGQQVIYVTG